MVRQHIEGRYICIVHNVGFDHEQDIRQHVINNRCRDKVEQKEAYTYFKDRESKRLIVWHRKS